MAAEDGVSGGDSFGEAFQVSAAQEALIRVFERILDVAAESNEALARSGGVVSCRLLAEKSQAGSVIGKGGKVIENIRKETSCKIRVISGDKLPACTGPNEELVEIEGEILALKKALVAVSGRIQECPPTDPTKIIGNKTLEAIPQEALFDCHIDLPRHRSLSNSLTFTSGGLPLSLEADRFSTLETETLCKEMVFRILCSNDKVGGVIGKGGSIIQALQMETGASISVGPSVVDCDERLITVTASENPDSQHSPAQNAAVLVFTRSVEAGIERGLDSGSNKESNVFARLVVSSNQVGCLLGRGGAIISEMRRVTGAGIRILGSDQVPKCIEESDEVVQISGEFVNVQDALCHVTSRLRDNLFASIAQSGASTRSGSSVLTEVSPYGRIQESSNLGRRTSLVYSHSPNQHRNLMPLAISHSVNQRSSLTRSLDPGLPHITERPSSPPRTWPSQIVTGVHPRRATDVGRVAFKNGLELGSGSRSAIVTNTTVEIVVPEHVVSSVYGENGGNLTRLRQISGAKVIVHEPHPETSDRIIVISGTPDETQAAQSLLQAFILTGS